MGQHVADADPDRRLSALDLITSDLDQAQKKRRQHYLPALGIAALVVVATMAIMGTRPDLLDQAPAQLALLAGLWVLCLIVFPAIGVGLLFVSRPIRIGLAALAIAGSFAAITGWPLGGHEFAATEAGGINPLLTPCFGVGFGAGVLVLGVGLLSGAFSQRRRFTAVYWIASGLALMSLNVSTWHCPATGLGHVLPNHLGAAAVLLGLAVVAGIVSRRRAPARP
jgi:hypothetical protein